MRNKQLSSSNKVDCAYRHTPNASQFTHFTRMILYSCLWDYLKQFLIEAWIVNMAALLSKPESLTNDHIKLHYVKPRIYSFCSLTSRNFLKIILRFSVTAIDAHLFNVYSLSLITLQHWYKGCSTHVRSAACLINMCTWSFKNPKQFPQTCRFHNGTNLIPCRLIRNACRYL